MAIHRNFLEAAPEDIAAHACYTGGWKARRVTCVLEGTAGVRPGWHGLPIHAG